MLNPIDRAERLNEPAELRSLSKSKIYELISREYLIPHKEARCSTRQYLISVHLGNVYRVAREQILNFEVGLSLEEKVKASFFHMGILRNKVDLLLTQMQLQTFGFPDGTQADEDWFTRVIRFIDQHNLLGAFKIRIRNSQIPRCPAGRMYILYNSDS
jgi:hypothetical protein